MALIIPKCNADPKTLDLTLKLYYDAKDWVTNADLIDNLSKCLINNGIEDEKKEPQSYTKKTQVLSYYGFIEWEDPENSQSRRRITSVGKKFYELRNGGNNYEIKKFLIEVMNNKTFGRNVLGCDSDSDIEAPNVFLKSALILGTLTNKEFAYIVGRMELEHADYADALFEVLIKRKKGENVVPKPAANKWADPKPILALADWGVFSTIKDGASKIYQVDSTIINNLGDEICHLRIKNTETNNYQRDTGKSSDNEIYDFSKLKANYLDALRTKPFLLLAGISGTGKSRIVRELAFKSCPSYLRDKDGTTPGNYCMIEVKPNWHDSSELLGYYSNISKKYIFTKFVKFLVKAKLHPEVPFFVCLDEMNLAPVEQYFAEFLSVLETRKLVKNDGGKEQVKSGTLVKAEFFKGNSDAEWYYSFNPIIIPPNIPTEDKEQNRKIEEIVDPYKDSRELEKEGLSLPENVFVIGTVNMDDTTHQFSRKVIDRAMTIEMNGGKLEDMFGGSSDLEYPQVPDDKILSMETLKAKYVSADDVLENCEKIKSDEVARRFVVGKDSDGNVVPDNEKTLPKRLNAINKVLENTPFQISYRVFNELVIYLAVLCDNEENKGKSIEELAETALDQITLMKILPRIEGDYDMFNGNEDKNKLEQLIELCSKRPESKKKLEEMNNRLTTTEFTRFWP